MYCIIYLDNYRRVKVYEEGGFQQEKNLNDELSRPNWVLANDEDWTDLKDVFTNFSNIFSNARNDLIVLEDDAILDELDQNDYHDRV